MLDCLIPFSLSHCHSAITELGPTLIIITNHASASTADLLEHQMMIACVQRRKRCQTRSGQGVNDDADFLTITNLSMFQTIQIIESELCCVSHLTTYKVSL